MHGAGLESVTVRILRAKPVLGNSLGTMNLSIQELKEHVTLRTVLAHYGHTDLPERNGKHFTCLFPENHARGDQRPSCNFYTGKDGFPRLHCFSCGEDHDQISVVERWENVNTAEAKKFVAGIGGIIEGGTYTAPRKARPPAKVVPVHEKPEPIVFPEDLRVGTEAEWKELAELRRLNVHAVCLAACSGILRFGTHRGFPSWIVTDESRIVAEARRMDGKPFPHSGKKPDTLKNGKKSWPVGIRIRHSRPELFRKIVVVEGSADLIAAYHFNYVLKKGDSLPVAMLGRECRHIHPEALPLFRGRHVRIFPHIDPDGGGEEAARRWSEYLAPAEVETVTTFDFSDLARKDGKPVSDLNDCTVIHPDDEHKLEGILP